ncbi:hypothetical protein JCM18909_3973 [Cutibacterium acnes JCM 18909]|nr:hypothetical protein JCM18909_3973 [Cutibacterium acnes JCM 18909]
MPENEDELTRNDDKAARNTLGRRTFLGGVTLVAAAAVAGTTQRWPMRRSVSIPRPAPPLNRWVC